MGNLITGKVRFSYVQVFEPRAINGGDEKYSVTLLIPKSDVDTYQKIMAEINKCLQENVANTFKGVMPANPSLPLYDGDGVRQSGEPFGPECKGHWVISAKTNTAPEVVDANCNPIISKSEFYSGCYGRASIRFYAYNQNGNKGIGCGLGNVQKLEDGQPLDGRTTALEDFGTPIASQNNYQAQIPQYQPISQAPVMPQYNNQITPQYQAPAQAVTNPPVTGQFDPITGQPVAPQQGIIGNIYGVN